MRDRHSQIISVGVLFIVAFLPTWLGEIWSSILQGKSDSILNFGFIYLGLKTIYQQRDRAKALCVGNDDRFLGYVAMLAGIVAFIFFHSIQPSISFRVMATVLTLIGIAMSSWGLEFFKLFPLASAYILLSTYPDTAFIAIRVCRFFTSDDMLEQVMASLGAIGLNLINYKATAQGALVTLSQGSVEVAPGCSGFEMAYTLLGCSLLFGLFMELSKKQIVALMALGWGLAMVCNVPRIMLLAIASVYWGQKSFDFWHGPIGGQIFSCVMFTIYYYAAMAIASPRSVAPSKPAPELVASGKRTGYWDGDRSDY
jgi:exosortase/archaeosortase family protein